MSDLPVRIPKGELPQRYETARAALEKCVEVDECKEWADKAKAIASYALQSRDESLYKMAVRIRARAIRRQGELIGEIEPTGGQYGRAPGGPTREAVAEQAGLSPRQRKTALRVAAVPKDDFESAVESDKPPSIKALAERGKKPGTPREGIDPDLFAMSTQGQAALGVLHRATEKVQPKAVVGGATKRERGRIAVQVRDCSRWMTRLTVELRRVR